MPRRNYLVTYDVSDDKRRNALFKLLEGNGDHTQYSVFLCELSPVEHATLRGEIAAIIHHRDDQVLILDLGTTSQPIQSRMEVLGSPFEPLTRCLVV